MSMKRLYVASLLGALVVHSCIPQSTFDPNNVLSNWTKETNFCDWVGILCSRRRQRVTSLRLCNMGLRGTISPHIGNLSFLQYNTTCWKEASLWGYTGVKKLQVISLATNNLGGHIPKDLSTLPFLRTLFLEQNNLQGTIPPFFGNTTSLEWFGVELQNIYGNIPIELSLLPNLNGLYCEANHLTGSIPRAIFIKSSMIEINLNLNALSGNLPTTIGLWLPNPEILGLQVNQLVGEIPLYLVSLDENQLTIEPGSTQLSFLTALTNCTSLQKLWVGQNKFSGTIPNSIGNFSMSLQVLDVSECQLMDEIPKEIGSLRNLNELFANNFHESIPSELSLLRNLGEIYLQENKLSGSILSCITKPSSLQGMAISSNKLTLIPSSLWNFENLRLLNLSFNSLNGSLDPHKALKHGFILELNLGKHSKNYWVLPKPNFSNPVKEFILKTQSKLSRKFDNIIFLGSFSQQFSLKALSHLEFLNLSCNKLSREIPSKGPFTNLIALSFIEMKNFVATQFCKYDHAQTKVPKVIFSSLLWIVKRHRRKNHSNDLFAKIEHKKISYQELQRTTTDFCEANLLGEGSYGSVYQGILSDGTIVAIKILNLQVEGAFRSFDTECEVLRTTHHRNLVIVITICSNLELRALVLQYMSNGSLDKWLYSHNYCLNLFQRVSIIALEYLHDGQSEPVVHCDLKPSNVLLDEDMIAHVADFRIAKNLAENKTTTQTNTLGTLGYIALEYGSEGRVSTSGDMYSYGIMLLETFTRKKPIDEMCIEERSLKQWVSTWLPDEVMEVVDSGLLRTQNEGDMVATQSNLIAILALGFGVFWRLKVLLGDWLLLATKGVARGFLDYWRLKHWSLRYVGFGYKLGKPPLWASEN
ncbi:hypothetical protein HYC85_029660 [Camellia sinensis]|uniref:Protein kinase domain-containing protein n=1 Tax=Camellia sinensis TaxID=4442 RepID=A0A7J7FYR2_CAMSI|nr:hypothetical protein HYC85_029660 [Camellia sinensis]